MSSLRGEKRTEFPQAIRKAAFARACMPDGIPKCEAPGCGKMIRAGHLIFEHVQPDGLGGQPTADNCKCYCDVCADRKISERLAEADQDTGTLADLFYRRIVFAHHAAISTLTDEEGKPR